MSDREEYLRRTKSLLTLAAKKDRAASDELDARVPRLQEMASSGDSEAQALLGGVFLEYYGRPDVALRYFESAASAGRAEAIRALGHMRANGIGCDVDLSEASRLFREAADAGDVWAKFNLAALLYQDVKSRPGNKSEIAELLESAADSGLAAAQAFLGDVLAAEDRDVEAFQWYMQAARGGFAPAMYVLGCWYRDGVVGTSNKVQSVRWFLRMLSAGDGDGVHEALPIARTMTADEIREAGRLAEQPAAAAALTELSSD